MRKAACFLGVLLLALWAAPWGMMTASAQSEGGSRPAHALVPDTGDVSLTIKSLTITSATVRFDPEGTDEFIILASFKNLSLASGQTILFGAGPFYERIPVDNFQQEGQKYTYTGQKGESGLSKLILDLDHGNATIIGKNLSLSDFSNPLPVGLIAGAFDQCTMIVFDVEGNQWSFNRATNASFPCVIPIAPELSDTGLYVGKAKNITVSTMIGSYGGLDEGSIQLVRVDKDLNVIGTPLCSLQDNGNPQNGDQSAGDRVFTCISTIKAGAPGTINLAVRALVADIWVFSPAVALDAVNEVTQSKFNQTVQAHAKAVQIWKNKASQYGVTREARVKAAAQIKKVQGIKDAGLSPDNSTIWIDFQSGIEGALLISPSVNGSASRLPQAPTPAARTDTVHLTTTQAPGIVDRFPQTVAGSASDIKVGNCKVFVYAPFQDELGKWDVADELKDLFANPKDKEQFKVRYLRNTQCTVAALKSMTDYGTVIIGGHGGTNGYGKLLVATREVFNKLSATYKFAVSTRSLARIWYEVLNEYYFAFKPNFVEGLKGSFKNSIVYIGACLSAYDKSFAKAFLKKGAKAYFGYSWITDGSYTIPTATKLFDGLVIRHMNTGKAMDRVRSQDATGAFRGFGSRFVKYSCGKNPFYLYERARWDVRVRGTVENTNPDGSKQTTVDENFAIAPLPDWSSFKGGFTGSFYEGAWNLTEDGNRYVGKTTFALNDDNNATETYAMAFANATKSTEIVSAIGGTDVPLIYQDDQKVVFGVDGAEACKHISTFTWTLSLGSNGSTVLRKFECDEDSYFHIRLTKY